MTARLACRNDQVADAKKHTFLTVADFRVNFFLRIQLALSTDCVKLISIIFRHFSTILYERDISRLESKSNVST